MCRRVQVQRVVDNNWGLSGSGRELNCLTVCLRSLWILGLEGGHGEHQIFVYEGDCSLHSSSTRKT